MRTSGCLDADALLAAARETGCDRLHPGYGFLSEDAGFARRCAEAGITFVGPSPEVLEVFGDKVRAWALAVRAGVPVLPGSRGAAGPEEARGLLAGGPVMIKAVGGGGGRGLRVVPRPEELDEAWERCVRRPRRVSGARSRTWSGCWSVPGMWRCAGRRATLRAPSPTCGTGTAPPSATTRS